MPLGEPRPRLIKAKPGEVIEFGTGKFEFQATLSLDVSKVTLRGQGADKTILSFKDQGQGTGGEGTPDHVEGRGDASGPGRRGRQGRRDQGQRHEGPDPETRPHRMDGRVEGDQRRLRHLSGALHRRADRGLHGSRASDAGIYVGQSENIIVRRNTVEQNVAGIEIENCTRADVYENTATDNAGGILVFTMPDLPKKDGRHCRSLQEQREVQQSCELCPQGEHRRLGAPGTGVMIMASDEAEVFDNDIEGNQTAGLSIVSYLLTEKPLKDEQYDPFCESIHVHHNRFKGNGGKPDGALGQLVAQVVGSPLPDMLYDGMINPAKAKDGVLPKELAIHIRDNGEATFANFDAPGLRAATPAGSAAAGAGKGPKVVRDLKQYAGELPPLAPVVIEGVQ
ncbi:MAG: parallel beta-helix domain-containing protein [Isosphaeraceae bacterium]